MLDPKFVRENIEKVALAAQQKKVNFDAKAYLEVYDKRLAAIEKTEELRRQRNAGSDAVKKAKSKEERESLIQQMRAVGEELSRADAELREADTVFESLLLSAPSIPSADTPVGSSDAENIEWKKVGTPPVFSFPAKDHIELGTSLGIVDFERGINVAGSRSYFLVGEGAQLERAVHNLAIDLLCERDYTLLSVPVMVRTSAMMSTGYLPGGEEQAYFIEKDDFWLVGTAEVSVASFHAGETLESAQLPIKLFGHSSCFRREAGAHGKDTKGLYRVHQFQKVEQVVFCEPNVETSDKLHAELLQNAEDILSLLELPYRVVKVCTGDLGQGQVKKHDIETWMPSRAGYGETHSCSSFHDFQARRLKTKIRDKEGKSHFAYTLNNTAAATPRLLIALLENHQTEDGRVRIPKALQKYMGNKEYLTSKKRG